MNRKPPYALAEIVRLSAEGLPQSQIASRFGISASKVKQIIQREKQKALCAERSASIRSEISSTSDLGRKLTVDDLFCVLNLPKAAEAAFRRHFSRHGITEFSLRDMMDFLIPVVDDARGAGSRFNHELYRRHAPDRGAHPSGRIPYADAIRALSSVDCGEALRAEWAERRMRLRESLFGIGASLRATAEQPKAGAKPRRSKTKGR